MYPFLRYKRLTQTYKIDGKPEKSYSFHLPSFCLSSRASYVGPNEQFTIWEPPNSSINASELHRARWSPDFKDLKLWKFSQIWLPKTMLTHPTQSDLVLGHGKEDDPRLTFSQLWSFEIRRKTFLKNTKKPSSRFSGSQIVKVSCRAVSNCSRPLPLSLIVICWQPSHAAQPRPNFFSNFVSFKENKFKRLQNK